ncbi:hypothetical protein COEREDRAFT_83755, partial [Coemansia reversa NRRL 1564]
MSCVPVSVSRAVNTRVAAVSDDGGRGGNGGACGEGGGLRRCAASGGKRPPCNKCSGTIVGVEQNGSALRTALVTRCETYAGVNLRSFDRSGPGNCAPPARNFASNRSTKKSSDAMLSADKADSDD